MPAVIRQAGPSVVAMIVIGLIGANCAPESTSAELRTGRGVYADTCSSCHGNRGQGGVGPALADVRETWPSCTDHQEWIALGTARWKAEHGPVYGANDTPITKNMPPHADRLTAEEIAAVAAFQRVEYGGGDPAAELVACGLSDE
jgi:mono/diheme cytochrome c family protein